MKILRIIFLLYGILFGVVSIGQTINAGNDTIICPGGTASLSAELTGGSYGTSSYSFQIIPYNPMPFTGGTLIDTAFQGCTASENDDCWAGPYDIGFSFCFFNQYYTQFWVGSNGWIGFTDPSGHNWTTYTSAPIPNTDPLVPKNCIMAPWEDWFPSITSPNVYYYLSGTAPNRKLVVYWIDCPMFTCPWTPGTFQIVINEQNSVIENNIANKSICNFHTATQGVHNIDGTVGFTASGRNSTVWATNNESTRFIPSGISWYSGGYPGGAFLAYGPTLKVSPAVNTTYTAVVETCGGIIVTDTVTVLIIDAGFNYPQAEYCRSDPDPLPVILQPGGTFTSAPPGLIFINPGTGQIDLSASAAGTYIVTYTITNTSCTAVSQWPVTIIDGPGPPVPLNNPVFRCGPGLVQLEVIQQPGETISWYDAPIGGNLLPYVGASISVVISSTTHFYPQATNTITGCIGLTRGDITATLKPIPEVNNSVLLFNRCSGKATNIFLSSTLPGSTFSWTATASSGNLTGYFDDSGTSIVQTIHNSGINIDTVYYEVTPEADGCTGSPVIFKVAVTPLPLLTNNPTDTSICNGQPTGLTLHSNIVGGTFTWDCTQTSGSLTGWAANPGPGATTINQTLFLAGVITDSVVYHITPEANGCPGPITDFNVIVNPIPEVTVHPMFDSICSEETTNILLTSTLPATAFTWTSAQGVGNVTGNTSNSGNLITDQLFNTLTTPGSILYTISPSTSSCAGEDTTFTMWAKPLPHFTNTPKDTAICSGQATGLTLQSDVTNTLFTWTATGSSAQISGYSDQTTPTTLLDQTLTNSGYSIEWVTYQISPTAAGCPGPDSNYVVTVFPVPDLSNNPPDKTICSWESTGINLTSNIPGTLFTWTATASSAFISGYSNNTTSPATVINQSLINSGTDIEWVTYHITPSANGCDGVVTDFTVTVYPMPDLTTDPLAKEICNNNSTNILLTSSVTGTLFTWSAFGSSANITGYSDNLTNPVTLIDQNLINSGSVNETVTYRIVPQLNGCSGDTSNYVVTGIPSAYLSNNPLDTAICSNQLTGIHLQSNVPGTQFTWYATGSSILVSGYSNSTSPDTLINQTLVNSGFSTETVTYHITPENSGCPGSNTDFNVIVNPVPKVSLQSIPDSICSAETTNLQLIGTVSGTSFSWTAAQGVGNISGFSNGAGSLIAQQLSNPLLTPGSILYTITPQTSACIGSDSVVTQWVKPIPALTNNPLDTTICDGEFTALSLQSNVPGTQFTWTATGSSIQITGYSNSTSPATVINQSLVNSGFDTETVTYHIEPENTGCQGSLSDYAVNVFPVPDVFFLPNGETLCEGEISNLSLQSHVTGTSFDWTATASSPNLSGFSDGSGDLIAQTIDNSGKTIEFVTYQVTPAANGCPPGIQMPVVLTVVPRPVITNTTTGFEQCNNTSTSISLESDNPGSTFAWRAFGTSLNVAGYSNGIGENIIQSLTNSGYTIDTVKYRVAATANGCPGDSTDLEVTVFPVADITFAPNGQAICSGQTTGLDLQSQVIGATFTWTATGSDPDVSGFASGSGSSIQQTLINSGYMLPWVTYQVTPTINGCTGIPDSAVVNVNPLPVVSLTPCFDTLTTTDAQPIRLQGGIPRGGLFSGPGVDPVTGTFNPGIAGVGTHQVNYTYINDYSCSDSSFASINVYQSIFLNCGDPLTDIRDNQTYPTVDINGQCWMAADLNFGNGILSSQMQRDNCVNEKYCYSDNPVNCITYGALYQWDEVMRYTEDSDVQGMCPPGWHIPSEPEWNTLFSFYISNAYAGDALKSGGSSGFNTVTSGIRFLNDIWKFPINDTILQSKLYWSSSMHGLQKAWAHGMNEVVANTDYTPSVSFYPGMRNNAFAVRCIRD